MCSLYESYTHEGFDTHGAQIITHEFQNALRWIIKDELLFPPLPDPYTGICDDITLAECYKMVFSAITDEMYEAIDKMFKKTVTIESDVDADIFVNGEKV